MDVFPTLKDLCTHLAPAAPAPPRSCPAVRGARGWVRRRWTAAAQAPTPPPRKAAAAPKAHIIKLSSCTHRPASVKWWGGNGGSLGGMRHMRLLPAAPARQPAWLPSAVRGNLTRSNCTMQGTSYTSLCTSKGVVRPQPAAPYTPPLHWPCTSNQCHLPTFSLMRAGSRNTSGAIHGHHPRRRLMPGL